MGREMVHLLAGSIQQAGRVPRRIVLSTELIARASSAGRAMS
jgi:hypothetical protein